MPSSLTIVRSLTLGFSPHLPVSVCGTGTLDLTSGFSWQREISRFGSFASPSQLNLGCADLPTHQPHCLDTVNQLRARLILLRPHVVQTILGGTGMSTCCPSHPERTNLPQETLDFRRTGFSPALRYSCQHSLSYAVHRTLRYDFCPHTMLLYRCLRIPKLRW